MEYVYASLLLHSAGREINEENIKRVLESAGIQVDETKVKMIVAALKEINVDEVPAAAPSEEKGGEEEEKEEVSEEEIAEGIASLFG
ncbi:MAG: 50S ribosomal protein P1 [Desulfurococcales archaeon ex4484_204]|nr:MAG: 50S ribosomal protein P1 [Desulfurococcales archaeon ex4484_204]